MPDIIEGRAEVDQLAEAAIAALRAPSIFNSQPWRWRLHGDAAQLLLDRERHLAGLDRDGRMLLLSCGAALHHAVVALGWAGYAATVERLPDDDQPDLLARLVRGTAVEPDPVHADLYRAIYARRTDRRPFADDRPSPADLAALRRAAERHGVHLHILTDDAVPLFAAAISHAAEVEHADESVRGDIQTWSDRPVDARDGITPRTTVGPVRRTVQTREFATDRPAALPAGAGTDRGTVYVILFTDADDRVDWLNAGEALSDVWLTLTARGLAASPISEVVEVGGVRQLMRQMLAGVGYPAIALRIGVPVDPTDPPPPSIRRSGVDLLDLPIEP